MRRAAWQRFLELPMPSSPRRRVDADGYSAVQAGSLQSAGARSTSRLLPSLSYPHALFAAGVELGGRTASMNSHGVAASLIREVGEGRAVRQPRLGSSSSIAICCGRFSSAASSIRTRTNSPRCNAACWSGGTLLYVPKGVRIDEPLHSLSAMTDGGVDLGKTLVILEPGAEATLLTETASTTLDGGGLHCGSIELIVEHGARLRYVNLQNWGHEVWHFAHQKAHVGREGRLQWTIGALGSRLAKVNQHVAMTGPDAEVQVNGVMFTEGRQHLSYNTHQHHQAPYCKSDLLYKTALQDRSRTVWRGMIKVDRNAQRTDGLPAERQSDALARRAGRFDSGSGNRGGRCPLHARQHARPGRRAASCSTP